MGDRGRGILTHCTCRDVVMLRTSKTPNNPGRLFYACRNGGEQIRYHLFKWTDEALVEEVQDMIRKIENLDKEVSTLEKGLQVVESDIQTITIATRTCEAVISGFDNHLSSCAKEIEDCKNGV